MRKYDFLFFGGLVCLFCWNVTICSAQNTNEIRGVIFEDKNGNGILDKAEKGLSGIELSNGETIVVSDKQGKFSLTVEPNMSVFPILPDNYRLTGSKVQNANYYRVDSFQSNQKERIEFPLQKKESASHFVLNAIGDVQVGDKQEMNYASQTLFSELLHDQPGSLNLFLGDLVNDNIGLLQEMKSMFEQLPSESWTVIGNHDRNADILREKQEATYDNLFGASTYAFNKGNVHFIILNNVYGTGARSYTGRISERQLKFVKEDLKRLPANKQLVFCMHIPLTYTQNGSELIDLLAGRGKVLVLSGHMHQVSRHFFEGKNVRVHELVTGASCGFWWVGEKDWNGIPTALMQCGSPRNYFVFNFAKNDYSFRFKGIGLDETRQMDIWVAGIDSTDVSVEALKGMSDGMVLATVYGSASEATQVRCRVDGGEWLTCERKEVLAPNVARLLAWNRSHVYPTKYSRSNPLRNRASSQVWGIQLPEKYCKGVHSIQIEATDEWGFTAEGQCTFLISD